MGSRTTDQRERLMPYYSKPAKMGSKPKKKKKKKEETEKKPKKRTRLGY